MIFVDFLAGFIVRSSESKTVARHLVTLRNFFRFAQIQDLISEDPSVNLDSAEDPAFVAGLVSASRKSSACSPQPRCENSNGFAGPRYARKFHTRPASFIGTHWLGVTDLDAKGGLCSLASARATRNELIPLAKRRSPSSEKYLRDARPKPSASRRQSGVVRESPAARH